MAATRVVCFPFAGSGAFAFAGWPRHAPGNLELWAYAPPGRDARAGEAALTDWRGLLADALAAVQGLPPGPMVFYGHSLGALLALDVAAALPGDRMVSSVIVAARAFPATSLGHLAEIAAFDDDGLFARLQDMFGPLPASMGAPDIRAMAAERLRPDLLALSTRPAGVRRPLGCRLTVATGDGDPSTPPEAVAGWATATTGPIHDLRIAGGHYFVEAAAAPVLSYVAGLAGRTI